MASDQNRRTFLQTSVRAAGAAAIAGAVAGCATGPPPARGTTSKAEAQYQDKPKGISRCGFCRHFYSPDICEIVSEPVSREGWCRFYTFL
jgi:nitrous oxide reductase